MTNKNKHTNLEDEEEEELKIITSFSIGDSFSTEWLVNSDMFESGDIIGGGEEGISPKEDKLLLEIYN